MSALSRQSADEFALKSYLYKYISVIWNLSIQRTKLSSKTTLPPNFLIWQGFTGLCASQERKHATSSNCLMKCLLCQGNQLMNLLKIVISTNIYISVVRILSIYRDNSIAKTELPPNFYIWLGFTGFCASQERKHATSSNCLM